MVLDLDDRRRFLKNKHSYKTAREGGYRFDFQTSFGRDVKSDSTIAPGLMVFKHCVNLCEYMPNVLQLAVDTL